MSKSKQELYLDKSGAYAPLLSGFVSYKEKQKAPRISSML